MNENDYGTCWVETETLLAAMSGDHKVVRARVADMLPDERAELAAACRCVAAACEDAR